MRVELPGENWAEIKDPDELVAADMLAVQRTIRVRARGIDGQDVGGEFTSALGAEMRNAMLARVIRAWSYETPVPGDVQAVEQIPLRAWRVLSEAIREHMDLVSDDAPNTESSSG